MPEEYRRGTICPIHKKKDKSVCGKYRGMALLSTVHKVFMKILARQLEPLVEDVIREYQCGFRQNRSTTDHIFMLSQILEKWYEYKVHPYQLYIDFKQAYDTSGHSKGLQP